MSELNFTNRSGALSAGAVNIGDVDVLSIAAGENHIGEVTGPSDVIEVTPTLSVAGAYLAGDYIGESVVPLTFPNVLRLANEIGYIVGGLLIDKAGQSKRIELWLFDTAPTPPNDNAAWAISDADLANCIGVLNFNTWYANANGSLGQDRGAGPIQIKAGATTIYGCLVVREGGTWADGDLIVKLPVIQD